jgi:diguanylate cyclase (GGDEF)-like protein
MIDLDHFKRLNDTHGHQAGDEALRLVGALLRTQLRAQDSVARYGGEEFAVLLPETECAPAALVAERIREAIAQTRLSFHGKDIAITASVGVAGIPSGSIAQPSDLVGAADAALYSAKHQGRNRVACAPVVSASDSRPLGAPRPTERDASA